MQHEGRKGGRGFDDGSAEIISACIEVHRHLGPGLLESVYQRCVDHELTLRGIRFDRQPELAVAYKGMRVESAFRADFIVEGTTLLELKSVEQLLAVHEAQVITYLQVTGLEVGLLINFNVPALKLGLRRLTRAQPAKRTP